MTCFELYWPALVLVAIVCLPIGAIVMKWFLNNAGKEQLGLAHTPESVKEALRQEIEDEHAMEYPE